MVRVPRAVSTGAPVLGELELAVLDHLWAAGEGDVKSAHDAVGRKRGISANTVQSALERLHRKGLLRREKVSHAFVYAPAVTRQDLAARAVEGVVAQVLRGQAEPMLSAFVDLAARAGDGQLARLERLIAERRARGGKR
jgi:predicted transcriptional regulator